MKYVLSVIMFLWAGTITAQNVLDGYIQEGLSSNLLLKQAVLSEKKAKEQLAQARAQFFPTISLLSDISQAKGGRTIDFPIGTLLNPVYQSLNHLTNSTQFPQVSNVSEQLMPEKYQDTKLRVVQPLLHMGIYSNYQIQSHTSELESEVRKSVERQVKLEIISAYYQWMQAVDLHNIQQYTLQLMKDVQAVNQSLVINQLATSDLLFASEADVKKAEFQVIEGQKQVTIAQSYVNFLLNKPFAEPLLKDPTSADKVNHLTGRENIASKEIMERPEIHQGEIGTKIAQQVQTLATRNLYLPEVFLVGDIGYQGRDYQLNQRNEYWMIMVSLKWNLFNGGQSSSQKDAADISVQQSKLKLEEVKRQLSLQVIQSTEALTAGIAMYQASVASEMAAAEHFRLIRQKYQQQQSLYVELMDAQIRWSTAKLAVEIAKYSLLIHEAEFNFATGQF